MNEIYDAHKASHGTYGHRRVHAELVLGRHRAVSPGRVQRLMKCTGLQGIHRRRLAGCTRRTRPLSPPMTCSTGSSPRPRRTGSTLPTSPSTARLRAGPTWRSCWTCSPAGSWAGQWPTIYGRSWSSPPCRWRSGSAVPARELSTTPITAGQYTIGRLRSGFVKRACPARWAASVTASTTGWLKASSPPCKPNYSTGLPGPPANSSDAVFA